MVISAQASVHILLLSASLYVLLNWFNVDTAGASFLPGAGHAFLIVAALHCFHLLVPRQLKIIPRQICELLGSESHIEHSALLLQLVFHKNSQSYRIISAEADA